MRILAVIFFMLMPFVLTAVLPSTIVHAHEQASDGGHHGHGHDHHHKDDCPKDETGRKSFKYHSHDGQAPEYVARDHTPLKQDAKPSLPAPVMHDMPPSRSIKPPLEPPSAA